ncbi:hypothetical protein KQX54_015254 [Cotesia glomerata]|uniref:Uncharacterized protein n=1 Tax=Cotesia glomerata TaxID=32391 RepID=A0AAV7I433_COTGL|nr:hypothetical protein KQX54_015254 [Cotesia glomerata]
MMHRRRFVKAPAPDLPRSPGEGVRSKDERAIITLNHPVSTIHWRITQQRFCSSVNSTLKDWGTSVVQVNKKLELNHTYINKEGINYRAPRAGGSDRLRSKKSGDNPTGNWDKYKSTSGYPGQ